MLKENVNTADTPGYQEWIILYPVQNAKEGTTNDL